MHISTRTSAHGPTHRHYHVQKMSTNAMNRFAALEEDGSVHSAPTTYPAKKVPADTRGTVRRLPCSAQAVGLVCGSKWKHVNSIVAAVERVHNTKKLRLGVVFKDGAFVIKLRGQVYVFPRKSQEILQLAASKLQRQIDWAEHKCVTQTWQAPTTRKLAVSDACSSIDTASVKSFPSLASTQVTEEEPPEDDSTSCASQDTWGSTPRIESWGDYESDEE